MAESFSNSTTSLLSCTTIPSTTPSDAGIAGAGILLAFITTAFLAILLSAHIIIAEGFTRNMRPLNTSRRLLGGLSDQQFVEGIAIQALGLARINSMVPYHFFVIWMLSLLSTVSNMAALLALVQDFKRDWVLRWLRQAAMAVNLGLTVVFGVFVVRVNSTQLPQTLPVGCIWDGAHAKDEGQGGVGKTTLSMAGTIAVIAASGVVFLLGTWYLHLRTQVWGRLVRVCSLTVLFVIAVAATVRLVVISQAFGNPGVQLVDQGEKVWSFGQLLAMAMLVLPFISALEIYRGELQVPSSCGEQGKAQEMDQVPLTGGDGGRKRYTYQTNPWFK